MTMIPLLDNLATLGLVVKEDDVDLLGQLRHRGEDEGEGGDEHDSERGHGVVLSCQAGPGLFQQIPQQ